MSLTSRVDRFRKRMCKYRVRSKEQQIKQMEKDDTQEDTVGYNLFCREMLQVEKRQQRSDIGNYKELEDLVDASQLIRDTGLNIDNDTITLFLGDVDVVEVESVKETVQVQAMKEIVQAKSVKEKQKICWMCGNSFSTTRLLLQHAELQHFYEYLVSNYSWEEWDSWVAVRCPHCKMGFAQWDVFTAHMVGQHQVLNTWLQENGFCSNGGNLSKIRN